MDRKPVFLRVIFYFSLASDAAGIRLAVSSVRLIVIVAAAFRLILLR